MATNPTLLTMPIAKNGQKNTIPATQAAAGDGLLSQSTGFPPETALPLGAGGKAPTREDFNGAFNLLSDLMFYAQKGWMFNFDAGQSYFAGCIVRDATDGNLYECLNDVAAGGSVPSADSTNWKAFSTGGGVAVGFIMPYAGTGLQEGWLDCDGSAVSRTMYPDLFAAIGTTWGAGDGSTTFNLPNLIDAAMLNGSYTKTSYTTAGSATFTAPKSGFYKITVKGAGGGGRGATSTAYGRVGGDGGGEGGTTIGFEHLTAGDSVSVVVGAGGAGGAAGGVPGSNGGDSSATINLNVYTGGGGGGGGDMPHGGTGTIPGAAGGSYHVTASTGLNSAGASGGGAGGGITKGSSAAGAGILGGGGAGGSSTSADYSGGNGGDGYVWFEYIGVTPKFLIKAFDGQTADSALIDITQYAQDLANRLTREQTPAFNHRDVVTTSGTYTTPVTGWYRITVKGGGGGGAGGGYGSYTIAGGGGGGEGGMTIAYELLTAGDTASVVVGAGGTGGTAGEGRGTNGGNSTVTINNNTYTGGGGGGTPTAQSYGGGAGGTGMIPGACGVIGSIANAGNAQPGGAGGGAGGGNGGIYNGNQAGANGTLGCGGGGGAGYNASGTGAGGNGGDGFVIFEYFAAV